MTLPNDYSRCHGVDCVQRRTCARHVAPLEDNVLYSWIVGPPEGFDGSDCPYYIFTKEAK
jgi:hypothetical protein